MDMVSTYKKVKDVNKDKLVLLRIGDYYTTYDCDAELVSVLLRAIYFVEDGVRKISFPRYKLDRLLKGLRVANKDLTIHVEL